MAAKAKRVLIGCGIGCAAVVLMALAVGIGFGIWLKSPGELLQPRRLLGDDTKAYAVLELSLDDPETAAFVELAIGSLQGLQDKSLDKMPGWVRSWQKSSTRGDIEKLFPLVVAWTLRPGDAAGEDLQLVSVSLQRASHQFVLADWFLRLFVGRDPQTRRHAYHGEQIYQLLSEEQELTGFIHSGNLFLTSDLSTAKLAVDRLGQEPIRDPAATRLEQLFATIPELPLRAALTNERGELLRLWREVAADGATALDAEVWDALSSVTLSAALEPDGSLSGSVVFDCPDAAFAEQQRDALGAALQRSLPDWDLDLQILPETRGTQVHLGLRIENLIGKLQRKASPGDAPRGAEAELE